MTVNNKNMEIESLRGIAVLLTMWCHVPFLLPFYSDAFNKLFSHWTPWTGVDLFFCISGYVVGKAYIEKFDQYRQRNLFWLAAQNFFIRRAYRLLPSAWLWALVGLFCSIFFNSSGIFASWYDNLRSIAVILTFSGNFANQYGLLLHPNHVYWSLALEEQFYFLFPLFLLLVASAKWRVRLLLTMIAIQFFINRNPFGTPTQGMASSFRLDAIMWGMLIAFFSSSPLYQHFAPIFMRSKIMAFSIGMVLLYLLVAIPAQLIQMPPAVGMIAIVAAILVFFASFNRGYIIQIPAVSPILIWMGARSYGIYLIHLVAYRAVYEGVVRYAALLQTPVDIRYTWPMSAAALILIIALADLNYRFIEVPLRDKGARLTRQREQMWNC